MAPALVTSIRNMKGPQNPSDPRKSSALALNRSMLSVPIGGDTLRNSIGPRKAHSFHKEPQTEFHSPRKQG